MLEDGTYDVLVVDAEAVVDPDAPNAPDPAAADAVIRVDVTVLAGPHKGEVIALTARGLRRDPLDLLAVPGTVTVIGGAPRLTLDA